jgi:NAD-dependent SIR2 family protein deacetylase
MNIFIRTKVGMSAESGLGTFRDKDGLWNSSKSLQLLVPSTL